ncbi:hypothetical protein A8V23_11645 [Yersinia pestis]|nr:hypothetical protein A1122_16100 [Yersinia pestis A1122]ANW14039.1 hypothetical protein BAY22_08630 [Yersinia pestis]EKS46423.1 hypothetical protein INS_10502 [Yersinia pestis INS]ERP73633.1 hypothetical protein L327_10055 [Yersinia pestis S3]ERP73963.1 hypothetical protein L328_10100 [Yersinia pestis 24H]ERP74851.1 hypothetical protein L326_09955 [Yersinia pestis 113]ERP82857.1 hypothetical protein L325_09975 [Yersinia pestis 9]KJG86175.1 hypothetical protein RN23_06850 [Yersinia pestis 
MNETILHACNLKDRGYHCVLALNTRMYIAISMINRP